MEGMKEGIRWVVSLIREKPQALETWHESGEIDDEAYARWLRRLAMSATELEAHLSEIYPGGRLKEPHFWAEERFNNPAQPVVGICWHEARAYCHWLSAQLGQAVRLPSEVEWEAAARGAGGRAYAYGDAFDVLKGNVLETRSKRSTPVGVFVEGDTPEGLSDLSGNVWEWTSSAWGTSGDAAEYGYPYEATAGHEIIELPVRCQRVLRGGSWFSPEVGARAVFRFNLSPLNRGRFFGFRVLVAPADSTS